MQAGTDGLCSPCSLPQLCSYSIVLSVPETNGYLTKLLVIFIYLLCTAMSAVGLCVMHILCCW